MKHILVLTGSVRYHGNSDLLADAFISGAKAAGHNCIKFAAAHHCIHGCSGCNNCWKKGRACIHKDDFQELEPLLECCDTLCLSFPLYWSSMPAPLKAIVERFYAYCAPDAACHMSIRESVLLTCGECEKTSDFTGAVDNFLGIASYMRWTHRGTILVPGVHRKGAIADRQELAMARCLGGSL